jgi:hypothetical protein
MDNIEIRRRKAARKLLEKNGLPTDDDMVTVLVSCCSEKSRFKKLTSTMMMYIEEYLDAVEEDKKQKQAKNGKMEAEPDDDDDGEVTEPEDDAQPKGVNHNSMQRSWYQMVTGEPETNWKEVTWIDDNRHGTSIQHNETAVLYNAGHIVCQLMERSMMEKKCNVRSVPLDMILEHGDLCDYLGNENHQGHMFQLHTMSHGLQTDGDLSNPNYFQSYVQCNTPNTRACIMTAAASIARRDHAHLLTMGNGLACSQLEMQGFEFHFFRNQLLRERFQSVNGLLVATDYKFHSESKLDDIYYLVENVQCMYHRGCSVDFQVSRDSNTITPIANPFRVHLVCATSFRGEDRIRREIVLHAAYRNTYGAALMCNVSHLWIQILDTAHLEETLGIINYTHRNYRSNLQVHVIDPLHLCRLEMGRLVPTEKK